MKKIVKALAFIVAPVIAIFSFFTGCKGCKGTRVTIPDNGEFMRDIDVAPDFEAYYEAQTKQVIAEYKAVASRHLTEDGEIDTENAEVVAAANSAAAKLYAYACYNESQLDKFVYFSNQTGTTDISGIGAATADRQEYYLRVNETEQTCGYRFHRTIKKVKESTGTMGTWKGLFESARIRMTDKTDLLYRFEGEGSSIRYGGYNDDLSCNVLAADWRTGDDWGVSDVIMKKGAKLNTLEEIEADIQAQAGNGNGYIHGNINILADNIVKNATVFVDDDESIFVVMSIDTEVANADQASMTMLKNANGTSGNCNWKSAPEDPEDTGLLIVFFLWPNGLFKTYTIAERWEGKMDLKIAKPTGTADSQTNVVYSYSDHDCDMTAYLEMLEHAKNNR
ncbi:MAG: hypothetical protein K2J83_03320 [Clostridia bacterium]|nr:hypothetical protein [Clostridia bacterium]